MLFRIRNAIWEYMWNNLHQIQSAPRRRAVDHFLYVVGILIWLSQFIDSVFVISMQEGIFFGDLNISGRFVQNSFSQMKNESGEDVWFDEVH